MGEGHWGVTSNEYSISLWGNENALQLVVMYNSVNILKTTQSYMLNINFLVCKFYINKAIILKSEFTQFYI